jgi:DNA (cytosine-5)-methyltransferase 1
LLDLYCGAGGAAMGYHRAGFDQIVGVDIAPQPDYPFEFVQRDALWFMRDLASKFDAIHASPPCQAFTDLKVMWNAQQHEDLLTPTRALLKRWGGPYVIENVPGAPMRDHVTICGSSLGLGVVKYDRELRRHRHFECNFAVMVSPCAHQKATIGIYGDHARDRRRKPGVLDQGVDFPDSEKLALGREAMGMPWVTRWKGLSQAIPPAYTEHIGHYLMAEIERRSESRSSEDDGQQSELVAPSDLSLGGIAP